MKQHNRLWLITGLVTISFGTVLAILTIPNEPHPAGSLRIPAFILSVGLLFVPVLRGIRSFETGLRTENILCLGLIYWLLFDLLQAAYPLYGASREGIITAFGMIGLAAIGIWVGAHGRQWILPSVIKKRSKTQLDEDTLLWLIILFFSLGIFKFVYSCDFDVIKAFSYLGSSRWSAPWSRGQLGGWNSFLDHMQYFGYLLPCLLVMMAQKRGWLTPTVLLSLALTVIMLAFLSQGGGRRVIGVIVGAGIVAWSLMNPSITIKRLTVIASVVIILMTFMQAMLVYRGTGYLQFGNKSPQALFDRYQYFHVDDNFFRLSQIIDIIPRESPFIYEKQIIFALIKPIPRILWPGKPITPGFDLSQYLGKRGVSLSTSVVGEFYLSWGWAMVFIGGWFYGKLGGALNHLLDVKGTRENPLVYAFGVMVLFAGLRSMQDLVIMSYGIIAWLAIIALPAFKQKVKYIDKISTH